MEIDVNVKVRKWQICLPGDLLVGTGHWAVSVHSLVCCHSHYSECRSVWENQPVNKLTNVFLNTSSSKLILQASAHCKQERYQHLKTTSSIFWTTMQSVFFTAPSLPTKHKTFKLAYSTCQGNHSKKFRGYRLADWRSSTILILMPYLTFFDALQQHNRRV